MDAGIPLDLTVLDVHVCGTSEDANAFSADMRVRDVDFTTVLGVHGITIELQIAIVNM